MHLSIVIPVLNERESLPRLVDEITAVCGEMDRDYEVVIIDDGSTDGSFDWIKQKSRENARIKGMRFRYNCGKAAALSDSASQQCSQRTPSAASGAKVWKAARKAATRASSACTSVASPAGTGCVARTRD